MDKKIEELILKSAQAEDSVMTRVIADMMGHKAEEESGKVAAAVEAIKQFLAEHGRDVAAGALPIVGGGIGALAAGKDHRLMGAGIGVGAGVGGALAVQPKIGIAVLRKLKSLTGEKPGAEPPIKSPEPESQTSFLDLQGMGAA